MSKQSDPHRDERFRVIQAEFQTAAPGISTLPLPVLPEVAFIGRSNVGKSTLLNSLCGKRALARVSKTPGRTQAFQFYKVDFEAKPVEEGGEVYRSSCHFVDLPGFGYAKVSKTMQREWAGMIEKYLLGRPNLHLVLLLVDSRRGFGEEERWVSSIGHSKKLVIAMTKSDKLSGNELREAKKEIAGELRNRTVYWISTLVPKKSELSEMRQVIFQKVFS